MVNTHHRLMIGMINVLSGILLVIILTLLFTIMLIGGTAVFLLSSARAIVHQRSIGDVYSKANMKKGARFKPILHNYSAVLINVRNESIKRFLTTFSRPGEIKLFEKSLYFRPYLSRRAYLINIIDVIYVGVDGRKVTLEFSRGAQQIRMQYLVKNASQWLTTIQELKSKHK